MHLEGKFPKIWDKISYDKTRTVLTIPVELEPETDYEFGLNAEGHFTFASETGDLLYPVVIRFKTKKAGNIRGSQSLLILSSRF